MTVVASTPQFLDANQLQRTLSILEAIDALEVAFAGDMPHSPVRSHYVAQEGELLLMPAWGPMGVGVKLITLDPMNPDRGLPLIHGLFIMFAPNGKWPQAMIDGQALTALRTAAVSALSVRHLARQDARRLLIFGAGRQAHAHLEAMMAVRNFESLVVVDPAVERGEELIARGRAFGLASRLGTPDDIASADVVCCCTTSRSPVVRGALLQPGTHVIAMGAYRPDMREVDVTTLRRSRVIVEQREAVLAEAGDFLIPWERGEWDPTGIHGELSEVVRGPARRRDADEITLCKTVGMASEDLIVARAAITKLLAQT